MVRAQTVGWEAAGPEHAWSKAPVFPLALPSFSFRTCVCREGRETVTCSEAAQPLSIAELPTGSVPEKVRTRLGELLGKGWLLADGIFWAGVEWSEYLGSSPEVFGTNGTLG